MAEENSLKISKTMLIIKSDANSLKGVEQFLKNREWKLKSTHQLKDAVLFLVQQKPSFVLVSIDHPNRKMQKLPKVLASAFPCCVMVYAEKSSTASFKALLDSGAEYKINPPITGPAIERAVNKYIRDQEQALKQKDPNATGAFGEKGDFEFQVEVKSGSDKEAGFVSMTAESGTGAQNAAGAAGAINSSQSQFAQNLLAQLGANDDELASLTSSQITLNKNESDAVAGSLNAKKTSQDNAGGDLSKKNSEGQVLNFPNGNEEAGGAPGSLEARKRKGSNSGGPDDQYEDSDAAGSLSGSGSKKGKRRPADGGDGESPEKDIPDVMIGRARSRKDPLVEAEEEKQKARELYVPSGDRKKSELETPDAQNRVGQDIIIGKPADDVKGYHRDSEDETERARSLKNDPNLHLRQGGEFNKDSVLVRGVVKTIEESVVKVPDRLEQKLEDSSHLACIVVESERFSGYLVAALGKDKKLDDDFVELIRTRLLRFLKDNGESVDGDSNLQLKVKRVDFEGWAFEYAQFLKKSIHKGDEVAMAFFPFADARTQVGESAAASMVSVKTSEIRTDVPLDFNLYIYLPTNKRYILYTPENGKFLEEQKKRLVKQGMSQMHIKKDDVQKLSKFKAQNHLNSLIDQYEELKKIKKKAS